MTARTFHASDAGARPAPRAVPTEFRFVAGAAGDWRITRLAALRGKGLPSAERLAVFEGTPPAAATARVAWMLRGVTSNARYTTAAEHQALLVRQSYPGRPEATVAALIPIRKADTWWALSQDERRAIFEDRSRHIATSIAYLPAIARRLHHGRDLGEPFDFLTWFEYAPGDAQAFEDLVARLRATEEWSYVEREVDIRLTRAESETSPPQDGPRSSVAAN